MITVIGSINMDLAITMKQFPHQGETVFGNNFTTIPGGKGANQAVACARLGQSVHFIGCVGSDVFGSELIENLKVNNVSTTAIDTVQGPTGIANILVYDHDNRIIVVQGANLDVTIERIDAHWGDIIKSDLVIMQLEIPQQTTAYVIKKCKEAGIPVLLNPAPADQFLIEWMEDIEYLTPNETECQQIFNAPYEEVAKQYPNRVIVTLGSQGACYHNGNDLVVVNSYPSQVVDTTGAGDTFNGALAYAITNGIPLIEAVRFANITASISVEKFGAQGGMPNLEAVKERMSLIK